MTYWQDGCSLCIQCYWVRTFYVLATSSCPWLLKAAPPTALISHYVCHLLVPSSILHPQLMQQDPNQTAQKSDSCNCRGLSCRFIGDSSWKGWQASLTATCSALVAHWNGSINSISRLNLDPEWGWWCVGSQSGLFWKGNAFIPPTDKQMLADLLAFQLTPESQMRERFLMLLWVRQMNGSNYNNASIQTKQNQWYSSAHLLWKCKVK